MPAPVGGAGRELRGHRRWPHSTRRHGTGGSSPSRRRGHRGAERDHRTARGRFSCGGLRAGSGAARGRGGRGNLVQRHGESRPARRRRGGSTTVPSDSYDGGRKRADASSTQTSSWARTVCTRWFAGTSSARTRSDTLDRRAFGALPSCPHRSQESFAKCKVGDNGAPSVQSTARVCTGGWPTTRRKRRGSRRRRERRSCWNATGTGPSDFPRPLRLRPATPSFRTTWSTGPRRRWLGGDEWYSSATPPTRRLRTWAKGRTWR